MPNNKNNIKINRKHAKNHMNNDENHIKNKKKLYKSKQKPYEQLPKPYEQWQKPNEKLANQHLFIAHIYICALWQSTLYILLPLLIVNFIGSNVSYTQEQGPEIMHEFYSSVATLK